MKHAPMPVHAERRFVPTALMLGNVVTGCSVLAPAGGDVRDLHASVRPRGDMRDVATSDGIYLAAANYYGAVTYSQDADGEWHEDVHGPFMDATRQVAIKGDTRFLMQPDRLQVVALLRNGTTSTVFSGKAWSQLVLAEHALVVSAGDTLHFAALDDFNVKRAVIVHPGDTIEALASSGEAVYAATSAGVIHRVQSGALHAGSGQDARVDLVIATPQPVRLLATDGDHLYYALGRDVHRLRLSDRQDDVITLDAPISAINYGDGRLWLAMQNRVKVVDVHAWVLLPGDVVASPALVHALDTSHDQLLLGLGSDGASLHDLPQSLLASSAALASPVAGSTAWG
jgi:hypothetical protein